MCFAEMASITDMACFDYAIIGGGTAGLTLAARLTENPAITVAVLEAGLDRSDDVNVLAPGLATLMYGNPEYDWMYQTTPQVNAFVCAARNILTRFRPTQTVK
jgi:choline dehydrogenase-like flavoprotein